MLSLLLLFSLLLLLLLALLLRRHKSPEPRDVEGHDGVLGRKQGLQVAGGKDVAEPAAKQPRGPVGLFRVFVVACR